MQFVDKAFARRLEAVEEMPQVFCARSYQTQRPEIGAAEEKICGGHMVFAGLGSPIGRAVGLGLDRPLTAADLDVVEQFYREHRAPSQIDVCPLHDEHLFEMLKQRGYGIAELNNVLYRRLDSEVKIEPLPAGCEIRHAGIEEAESCAEIVERAFFPDGAPQAFAGLLASLYQIQDSSNFVATMEGRIVACAAGMAIAEHRVFGLFGAGTLSEYRGRGLQTALLRARMAEAAKAGCEYAVVVTRGGTISQRNCEKLGFRVAYSKATAIREAANVPHQH